LFFTKGSKTEKVEFRDLSFNEVNIDGQKTKVIKEDKLLGVIDIKTIKEKNYSLKPDDYFKEEVVIKEEDKDKWVKLGDICDILKGKTLTIDKMVKGPYKVIGGGYIPMKETHNEYNVNENEILISNDGAYAGYLNKFNENIFITSHCNKIVAKNINKDLLWYYLKFNQKYILINCQKGQAQPSLDKNKLLNEFKIPNLSIDHQEEIVKFLDKQFENYNINNLKKDVPIFKLLIAKQYEMATDLLHVVYRQIASGLEIKNIEKDMKAIFNLNINKLEDCETKRLGDICEIKSGKAVNKVDRNGTKYPYFASNGIIGYLDNFTHDNKFVICAQDGTIGSVHYYEGKIWASNHVWLLTGTNINLKYLYYIMKYYINYNSIITGNAIPKLTKYNLENIQVKIPSLEIQQEIVNKIEKIEKYKLEQIEYASMIKQELDNYIKNINDNEINENIINNSIINDTDLEVEIEESEIEDSEE